MDELTLAISKSYDTAVILDEIHYQKLKLQLQSYTQRIVLRGIMQCYRLVGKDGFSALIGTVGDC